MKSIKIKHLAAPVIAIAVICLCAYAYEMGKSSGNADIDSLRNMISTLEAEHYDAAVTKRVSRQMEDIAYQQKSISDQQRALAEQNAAEAKQNAAQAALNADEARQNAARAQHNAEEARLAQQQAERNADEARHNAQQAKLAKDISDTINFRSMGRTLGRSAQVKHSAGDNDLASLLAYASWYFLEKYKGNHYLSESYQALLACTSTHLTTNLPRFSSVNAAAMLPGTSNCIVATGYGEVFLLTIKDNKIQSRLLYHDKTYDFRSLHITSSGIIYALSNDGTLLSLTTKGLKTAYPTGTNAKSSTKPHHKYKHIIPAGKDQLLLVAEKELTWFNTSNARRTTTPVAVKQISTACRQQNIIQIFYTDASYAELTLSGTLQSKPSPVPDHVITSASHSTELGFTYYGTSNGVIRTVNSYGNWLDLVGHTTRITSISHLGDIMVANSYDHETHLWNMPQLHYAYGYSLYSDKPFSTRDNRVNNSNSAPTEWQVPSNIHSDGWPLCSSIDPATQTIWIGTSNGQIHNVCLSADILAEKLRKNFKRDLTAEEWEQYVGVNIKKVNFK